MSAPANGPTTETAAYAQSPSRLPGTGSTACASRGPRSHAGLIAYPVVPPGDRPIAKTMRPTGIALIDPRPMVTSAIPPTANIRSLMSTTTQTSTKVSRAPYRRCWSPRHGPLGRCRTWPASCRHRASPHSASSRSATRGPHRDRDDPRSRRPARRCGLLTGRSRHTGAAASPTTSAWRGRGHMPGPCRSSTDRTRCTAAPLRKRSSAITHRRASLFPRRTRVSPCHPPQPRTSSSPGARPARSTRPPRAFGSRAPASRHGPGQETARGLDRS